jgi:hypothetical protein
MLDGVNRKISCWSKVLLQSLEETRVVNRQHSSPGSVTPKRDQTLRSRSQGQKSWYEKKGVFIMHLYLKYQNPNTFGSKDKVQVRVFSKLGQSSRSRSQGQKPWYHTKGLFIMHLYLKYQSLNTFGSKDIAQVKVFQN